MLQKRIRKQTNNKQDNKAFEKLRKYWREEEDQILKQAVQIHGSNWKIIAEYLCGRNASQCAQRWKRVKPDNEEKNQKWTIEEDELVRKLTKEYQFDWKMIAKFLSNRTGRQIRERYINHLDPSISTKAWSQQEDLKIWTLYQKIGSRWSDMAKKLKGRPENMIKNRFYGYIRKTYAKQENPYYIVPMKNRELKEVVEKEEAIKIEDENVDERLEDQQQGPNKKKQKKLNHQQEDLNLLLINPIFQSINTDNFTRNLSTNIHEQQQFSAFQKYTNESMESEMIKNDHFNNFQQGDSNFNSHNYISYTPQKEQKEEENDNFVNQFLNLDSLSKAVQIRADIFEDLTKNSLYDDQIF